MADEIAQTEIPTEMPKATMELKRIGTQSTWEAQEENRRLNIPNAYSRNGTLYFELPDGTITQEDPFAVGDEEQPLRCTTPGIRAAGRQHVSLSELKLQALTNE